MNRFSVGAGVSSPASTDADSPTFPLYLLPSISFPFRRRRTSGVQQHPSPQPPPLQQQPHSTRQRSEDYDYDEEIRGSSSAVPSLSSSPESETYIASPRTPDAFPSFYNLDTGTAASSESSDKQRTPATQNGGSKNTRLSRLQPDTLRCRGCATDIGFHFQIVSKGFTGRHGRAFLVSPPSKHASPSTPVASPLNEPSPENPEDGTEADLINIVLGPHESRQLVTGQHIVADISCKVCGLKLGWKYVDAREEAQKYKVGKFILETMRVVVGRGWGDAAAATSGAAAPHEYDGGLFGWKPEMVPGKKTVSSHSARSSHDSSTGSSSRTSTEGEETVVFDSDDEDECEDLFAGVWDAKVVAKRRQSRTSRMRRAHY